MVRLVLVGYVPIGFGIAGAGLLGLAGSFVVLAGHTAVAADSLCDC